MQATYGIGGYGFLLTPSPACRVMVSEDDDLVLLRGDLEVALITPGEIEASGEATWLSAGIAQFGDGGPLLELADGVDVEAVFQKIDTGLPHVAWSAMASGMMLEL